MSAKQGSKLFRKQALDRLQSPERLDKLMAVVSLSDWIPILALAIMAGMVVVWSVVGSIPVTVAGRSALIYPRQTAGEAQIVQVESKGSGAIVDIRVNRGDQITQGQLLAVIDQPELRKQVEINRI